MPWRGETVAVAVIAFAGMPPPRFLAAVAVAFEILEAIRCVSPLEPTDRRILHPAIQYVFLLVFSILYGGVVLYLLPAGICCETALAGGKSSSTVVVCTVSLFS